MIPLPAVGCSKPKPAWKISPSRSSLFWRHAPGSGFRSNCVGEKNGWAIGHPEADDRSAIVYSIIASCARRHIDALAYLRDVLSRLPTMTTADDLDALTPALWKPASTLVS